MKFVFVRLVRPDYDPVFMRVLDFLRYSDVEPFSSTAVDLVVFDHIHIDTFLMLNTLDDILEYNPDAFLESSIDLHDIAFGNCGLSRYCNLMGYEF